MEFIKEIIRELLGRSKPRTKADVREYFCSILTDDLKTKLFSLPHSAPYKNHKTRIAKVIYSDNIEVDCVLFVTENQYWCWGPSEAKVLTVAKDLYGYDYNSPYRLLIDASKIVDIVPCPYQLPPKWCNKIYKFGEGYMGGYLFNIYFKDGNTQLCLTGDIVDFITLREGYFYDDIVDVKPHRHNRNTDYSLYERGPSWVWCVIQGSDLNF